MKKSIVLSDSEGRLAITVLQDDDPDAKFGKVPEPALVKVGGEAIKFKTPEDFDEWIHVLQEAKRKFEKRRQAA